MVVLIRVLKTNNNGDYKEVYRNNVSIDDSINFPFENLLKSLKFLYPKHIVEFKIM